MTERSLVGEENKDLDVRKLELRNRYLGEDLVNLLTEPTPESVIGSRPIRGGGRVKYVAGPHFVRKLNDSFGFFWSYEVPESFEKNGQIVGRGRLTVQVPHLKGRKVKRYVENGKEVEEVSDEYEMLEIVKEQFGSSEIKRYSGSSGTHKAGDVIDLGDDYKGMGTDAFKKCATLLGVFLDVYESRAASEEGVVSSQQLNVFYMRAEKAGMNKEEAEKWGEKEIGKPMGKWSDMEIMEQIPKLLDMEEKNE